MASIGELLHRRYVGSAAALVAGALLGLSFAPIGWWPMAVLSPALLICLWDGASPRRAAVLGFWFNAGTFSVGTYWLYISLRLIGHAPIPLALLLMAALVVIMGSYHALLGWVIARCFPARGAVRWLVAIPGAWLLIEWFRSWFLSGFGWLALGYAHTDNWLGGLAPVIGQFGLGLLSVLLAGSLVALLLGTQRSRAIAAAVLAASAIAGLTLRGVEWTRTSGKPITVAIVQGAIPQDEKWIEDNLPDILDTFEKLTVKAHGADLIVWPESTIPDPINYHVDYIRRVYQAASASGSSLVMGAIRLTENEKTGEEEAYNSVLVWDRATPGVGLYDKYHLVPFSEFFPVPGFIRKWLRLMELPYADFNRGADVQEPLDAAGQKISIGICYEDAYAANALPGMKTATMLVNVTNDSWFGHSTARYQHLQISRMRALETGRPMVRAANDGVSAIIGAHGEILAAAPEYEANVMRAAVQPRTGLTPYARTGNWPVVSLALVFSLFGAYLGRRRKTE
ncbi:MAG TPA: apolipoprotein N-acyltransferase [Steroidobacteraceae bacterium]|nr:apolipoprotein N-acyltransferase [Steroidobacteraceae bacterium]